MARPSELFSWSSQAARVRAWLGLSGTTEHDAVLEQYSDAAGELADNCLGRDDFETLPAGVRIGCLSAVRVLWERRDQLDVVANRLITSATAADAARSAASAWWDPYRSAEAL